VLQHTPFETENPPLGLRRDAQVPAELVQVVDARFIRLVLAFAGAVVVLGVPSALGQSMDDLNRRMSGLRDEIAAAKEKEGVLTHEIRAASERIEALDGDIGDLQGLIEQLEVELAAMRARLDELKALEAEQTEDFEHLKRQLRLAQLELERRLVELYQNEEADSFEIILQVRNLGDLLDQLEYFDSIGKQDQRITEEISGLKEDMRVARQLTRRTKKKVAEATAIVEEKTAEKKAAQAALIAQQQALDAARANKRGVLAGVREDRAHAEEDLDELQAASAALAERLRNSGSGGGGGGGSTGDGTSSSGFIWPVSGVVTSGFGWRWGRMHEGIDISAPAGSTIRAVAAGTVIYAGWMGGYGNLTIVDHGNGLATAYAHQSAIYVGGGSVSQGTALGAVGCTGSCTGNHLHFEVRVNGSAVDPMGYL
jgi:murein DD-endopeptidase MepM/ murein hydrolase activator NlpD